MTELMETIATDPTWRFPSLLAWSPTSVASGRRLLIEEKLDGEALVGWVGHAYGRRVSEVTGKRENKWERLTPQLRDELGKLNTPVMGELHLPSGTASQVKTAMKEQSPHLQFTAHTLLERSLDPLEHLRCLRAIGMTTPRVLNHKLELGQLSQSREPLSVTLDTHETLDTRQLLDIARAFGLEGFVLKEFGAIGEPAVAWWKLRVTTTYDLVVTGVKDGQGQHFGSVGALRCSAYSNEALCPACFGLEPGQATCQTCHQTGCVLGLIELASVGGMSQAERDRLTNLHQSGKLINSVVEVKCNGLADAGRLLMPRYVRLREDKLPEECLWPQ